MLPFFFFFLEYKRVKILGMLLQDWESLWILVYNESTVIHYESSYLFSLDVVYYII